MAFTSSIPGLQILEAKYHAFTDNAGTTQATNGQTVKAIKGNGLNFQGDGLVYRTGLGLNNSPVLDFTGQSFRDVALQLGAEHTIGYVGFNPARGNINQGWFSTAGTETDNHLWWFIGQGSTIIVNDGNRYEANGMSVPNYPALFALRQNDTNRKVFVDDKTPITINGLTPSLSLPPGLYLGSLGNNYGGRFQASLIFVHPTHGLTDAEYETLRQELIAYYGPMPAVAPTDKVLVIGEGNSYLDAEYVTSDSAHNYKRIAATAIGASLRSFGCSGSGTGVSGEGPNNNDMFARMAYVNSMPGRMGKSLPGSILCFGEGVNDTDFNRFKAYVLAQVAAGWGQIVLVSSIPSLNPGNESGLLNFYNQLIAEQWPSNVRVTDLRAGITYNSGTDYQDVIHPNDNGNAKMAVPTQAALQAAKNAIENIDLGTENRGDSITFGQGASDYAHSWAGLLATEVGGPNVNYGVPGDDVVQQCAAMMINPPIPSQKILRTWATGINGNRGSYERVVPWAARAFLVQSFRKTSVPATDPSIVKVGTWTTETVKHSTKYYPVRSNILHDYIEWTFNGTNGFVTILHEGNNPPGIILACYKVYIDGVMVQNQWGFDLPFTDAGYAVYPGNEYVCLPFVFAGLSNGNHTIRIENFADYGNGADQMRALIVDEFGTLEIPSECSTASVSEIYPYNYSVHGGSNEVRVAKNLAIKKEVDDFIALGYPAKYVDFQAYTGTDTVDDLHPNNTGHEEIFSDYNRVLYGPTVITFLGKYIKFVNTPEEATNISL